MKNALIRSVLLPSKTKKKNQPLDPAAPRILLFSTTGVGDTLWATPAIRAIKKKYPLAHLSVVTSKAGRELLKNSPYIDEIISIDEKGLPKKVKEVKADTALIFHISQRIMMPLATLSKASRIVGSTGINKGLDDLLTVCQEKKHEHEIERRLRIVESIGVSPCGPEMEVFLTDEERTSILPLIEGKRSILAIHPGAKDRFKQWPPHLFAKIGKKYNGAVLITGGPDEKTLCEKVASQIPGSLSLAGKLNLRQLAALIEKVDLFLTNDTGPMHIAFAMKTKTLALFGPTDPNLCGPYKYENAKVFKAKPTCTPCLKKKCLEPFCMREIKAEELLAYLS